MVTLENRGLFFGSQRNVVSDNGLTASEGAKTRFSKKKSEGFF
jgi:hypothetical protein